MRKKTPKTDVVERQKAVEFVEASAALEGYPPLTPNDGIAYELREKWVNGEIGTEEHVTALLEHFNEG